MKIEIDKKSGFCFGVVYAITRAESELKKHGKLYCLGDIVHNGMEVERLAKLGLITIEHKQFRELKNERVLIRAHGEPPETYKIAKRNNIELIDASCPVVLKLQTDIYRKMNDGKQADKQLVIFGTQGHAEVNGLVGQTGGKAIVISSIDDIDAIDFDRPIVLFSQTTKNLEKFNQLVAEIRKRMVEQTGSDKNFSYNDSICRQVANRNNHLKLFARKYDAVVFVSGKKSSNGKALFEVCKSENKNTHFVTHISEIDKNRFAGINSIGVCGATSTPKWLMDDIAARINKML